MGAAIAGAEVRVQPGPWSVLTDSLGGFSLDSLTPGEWTARVRKTGFDAGLVVFSIPEGAQGAVELKDVFLRRAVRRAVTIAGTVRDGVGRRPIVGVSLRVGENPATLTDTTGRFLQRVIIQGNALVELTGVGFRPLRFDLWPGADDTVRLGIGLRPLVIQLAEVVVRGAPVAAARPELFRGILENRPDLKPAALDRTRHLMTQAVRDCVVTGYEGLIEGIELPDPDDRHVVAAAIRCGAQVIVTFNLDDFPADRLTQYHLEAQHPDDLVLDSIDLSPGAIVRVILDQIAALSNPPVDLPTLLNTLRDLGLVQSVARLRELF